MILVYGTLLLYLTGGTYILSQIILSTLEEKVYYYISFGVATAIILLINLFVILPRCNINYFVEKNFVNLEKWIMEEKKGERKNEGMKDEKMKI